MTETKCVSELVLVLVLGPLLVLVLGVGGGRYDVFAVAAAPALPPWLVRLIRARCAAVALLAALLCGCAAWLSCYTAVLADGLRLCRLTALKPSEVA
jgi:hypothetical protein